MTFGLREKKVRADYGLRGHDRAELERELEEIFYPIPARAAAAGDLLLVKPGPEQLHVVILTPAGYMHADAGLRRVVEVPGAMPWPVLSAWRHPDLMPEEGTA